MDNVIRYSLVRESVLNSGCVIAQTIDAVYSREWADRLLTEMNEKVKAEDGYNGRDRVVVKVVAL